MFDILIIGAGVIGSLTARKLAEYKLNICLAERCCDVCEGSSKANSAIVHAGFDAEPGTNKAHFNVLGSKMMESVCGELGVHYRNNGSLVLAFTEDEIKDLHRLKNQGEANGVDGLEVLNGAAVRALEPNVSDKVVGALRAKTGAIICPYMLTHQAVNNACRNGVELMLNAEVTAISRSEACFHIKFADGRSVQARYIINAAGVHADDISGMVTDDISSMIDDDLSDIIGGNGVKIRPRKGEYLLFDKKSGGLVGHTLFQLPSKLGKGVLVTPTVDGNLLVGPNASDQDEKEDKDTTASGLEQIFTTGMRSVEKLNKRDVITSFAGLRAIPQNDRNDFIIGFSEQNGFYHLAGILSPGLSASPAIAAHAANEIVQAYSSLYGSVEKNPDYNPLEAALIEVIRLSDDELNDLIKRDPAYGDIVCRCETVAKGSVIEAINGGATTIDGVKRRTRAGMGRCQGGFCLPRVMETLSEKLGIDYTDIIKSSDGSFVLYKNEHD